MNSITIAGQLGKDMESRLMPNGDPVGNFSIADSQGKDKPAIWWNCQLFGKRVESLTPYLLKGQAVTVAGTITEREWSDKEGNKRKSMEVRVNEIALQGGKPQGQATSPARQAPAKSAPSSGFDDMADDIPF